MAFENITRMTDEYMGALKGWSANMQALDFEGKLAAAVTDPTGPGAVLSLNPDGDLIPGVGNDAVMPLFAFYPSTSAGVVNSAPSPSSANRPWGPVSGRGVMVCLVATGAYELQSSNFVAGNYPPNTHLTSPKSTANVGKLMAGVLYTNTICGVVSRGIIPNPFNHAGDTLAFWPVYIPPVPG